MPTGQPCLEVFARCAEAIRADKLINRESRQDKEFHFQNWFKERLGETGLNFELGHWNPAIGLFAEQWAWPNPHSRPFSKSEKGGRPAGFGAPPLLSERGSAIISAGEN